MLRPILFIFILCALSATVAAEGEAQLQTDRPAGINGDEKKISSGTSGDTGDKAGGENKSADDAIKKKAIVGIPVNTYAVSLVTWDWGKLTKFRLSHEGWFGKNTYAGGADKAAHLYSHYLIMRVLYNIYDHTEDGAPSKWAYSTGITAFLALGIEIGDGFSKNQNGFSFADLTMGFIGIGIASLLELFPSADAFVSLSAEYYPTRYFRKHPQRLKWFLDDYSGWKFMANFKLAGFHYVGINLPDFLRYIMIDVGYFTINHMRFDYRYAEIGRFFSRGSKKREVFIGVSVNLMEVISAFFNDKESFACRALQQPFKYYHFPVGARQSFKL
jgi:hypothetical protein